MIQYQTVKHAFDFIIALILTVLLSPILSLISITVKASSPGPIFYRGERVGLGGRTFKIYKFRTMIIGAEKTGVSSTAGDDIRLTKVGKTLRQYKLDELPQLLNILRGEMSFVGPRPEVKKFTDLYTEKEKVLLTLRPGLTDYASIWDFDEASMLAGSADPDKDYLEKIRPTKIKLQLRYFREMSFATDIKIILSTIARVIKR